MKNLLFIHVTNIVSEPRNFSFLQITGLHLPVSGRCDPFRVWVVCSLNRGKLKKERKKKTNFNLISSLNFIEHFLCSYLCHNVDSNCVSVTNY
jgi:hypothetical protein